MNLLAVKSIDSEYQWKLTKYIIVEDDFDYGSQCDDTTNLVLVAELRNNVPIENWAEITDKVMGFE